VTMKRGLILFCLAVAVIILQVPGWSARMPRGSFLVEPAASVYQLTNQITTNPKVAARFERHYGVPADQFVAYARKQLGLRALKNSAKYRVYFIRSDGSIGSAVRSLRKGTAVFLHLSTGKPVLLAECGNPMGTGLPGYTPTRTQSEAPARPHVTDAQPPATVEEPLPMPTATAEAYMLDEPLLPELQVVDASLWEADPALFTPETFIFQGGARTAAGVPWLSPILGAGVAFTLGGGSSGGRGSDPLPPAVPEAGSLVLWLTAGAGLLGVGSRYQRRRTS